MAEFIDLAAMEMNTNYNNVLTPPSSSEDSPQPTIYYHSPPPMTTIDTNIFAHNQRQPQYIAPNAPYLRIIEQPVDKFRFRYRSEMTGTHGSLTGQNSDRSRRQSYPTVELCNWDKHAVIRCSLYQVNTDADHNPHPHRLIKKCGKGEVDDPHDLALSPGNGFVCIFHSMGIIHTAKKNIIPELVRKKLQLKKEEIGRKEGKYRELTVAEDVEIKRLAENQSKGINLNVVRLRFDAFVNKNGILEPLCRPVFSHSINNLKSALTGELKISRLDHCTSPAKGGREVFMLVERVTKKNVKIRIYEMDDEDQLLWEDYGKFSDLDVHHQYAIVFRTPPYRDPNIKAPVRVFIELERPTDKARSEAKEFTYTPTLTSCKPGSKRPRMGNCSSSYDTSMASDELPLPISDLSLGCNLLEPMVTSAELQLAMNNIDSAEFLNVFNDFGAEYTQVTTDAPSSGKGSRNNSGRVPCPSLVSSSKESRVSSLYKTSTREETQMAKEAIAQLRSFIKTQPSDEKAIKMLHQYLDKENTTNPLHVSMRDRDKSSILFLLKMIYFWKQNHLVNNRTDQFETPLHIAVQQNLDDIVSHLLMCKPDVSLPDADNNTALHIAVLNNCSISILETLLNAENVQDFIDAENDDGNTALNLAIDNKNMAALTLLYNKNADINRRHKKSGFTPLRFAIEKLDFVMVPFLLKHSDPLVDDFQGINPLQAGLAKQDRNMVSVIREFMARNDYCDVHIKNEMEDNSDEELEQAICVKVEEISLEELRELYTHVRNFTPECLDQLGKILDETGRWQDLVELLDLAHITRSGVLNHSNQSPTKLLLNLAVETHGDTVLQIRDFLENLDEIGAVQVIDNMVKSMFL